MKMLMRKDKREMTHAETKAFVKGMITGIALLVLGLGFVGWMAELKIEVKSTAAKEECTTCKVEEAK